MAENFVDKQIEDIMYKEKNKNKKGSESCETQNLVICLFCMSERTKNRHGAKKRAEIVMDIRKIASLFLTLNHMGALFVNQN